MPGKMYIDLRSDVKVPTLKIRREVLDSLRASLDQGTESDTAATTGFGVGRLNTIVAGALLSLALVFAGFLVIRGSGRLAKLAVPLVIVAAGGLGALTMYANTPPPKFFKITTRIFDPNTKNYGYISDGVVIKVIDRTPCVFTGMDDKYVILEVPNGDDKTTE